MQLFLSKGKLKAWGASEPHPRLYLFHLSVEPFEEFVFGDYDALAELDLGEAFGVDEFVGVCPGDAQELRHIGNAEHNGELIIRCVGFHSCNILSVIKLVCGNMRFTAALLM